MDSDKHWREQERNTLEFWAGGDPESGAGGTCYLRARRMPPSNGAIMLQKIPGIISQQDLTALADWAYTPEGKPEVFTGFTFPEGQLNAALYPPGMPCEAMDGCPINRHCWSVVTWYPGRRTGMYCFPTSEEGRAFIADMSLTKV